MRLIKTLILGLVACALAMPGVARAQTAVPYAPFYSTPNGPASSQVIFCPPIATGGAPVPCNFGSSTTATTTTGTGGTGAVTIGSVTQNGAWQQSLLFNGLVVGGTNPLGTTDLALDALLPAGVTALPVTLPPGSLVADTNSAAFGGEVALVVGTADTAARRSLKAICTTAGAVNVRYADGSFGTWQLAIGTQTLPIAITLVSALGTTATCTYANLK